MNEPANGEQFNDELLRDEEFEKIVISFNIKKRKKKPIKTIYRCLEVISKLPLEISAEIK